MKKINICIAMAIVILAAACQQGVVVKPKMITLAPKEVLPDKTYEEWKLKCVSAMRRGQKCSYDAMKGMILKAPTFEEAEDAFSYPSYWAALKRMALITMLRKARGNAQQLYKVAAYAGPIDKKIQALARRLERDARDN